MKSDNERRLMVFNHQQTQDWSVTLLDAHHANDDGHQAGDGKDSSHPQGPGGVRHTDSCDLPIKFGKLIG